MEWYVSGVDVGISELRSNMREWVERARAGDDVVVTERGVPVVRLVAIGAASLIERLEADGVLSRPEVPVRPQAAGRRRAKATGSVSDLVTDLRG